MRKMQLEPWQIRRVNNRVDIWRGGQGAWRTTFLALFMALRRICSGGSGEESYWSEEREWLLAELLNLF